METPQETKEWDTVSVVLLIIFVAGILLEIVYYFLGIVI